MTPLAIVGRWAIVLGITGFACGFVGPMAFAPESNQGPMLGISITGPGGALAGAILGFAICALEVGAATAARLLPLAAGLVAAITLYFSIPEPHYYADVVEGEISQCNSPERLRDQTVRRLDEFAAAHPPLRSPVAWGAAFDRALEGNRGVILDLHLARFRRLYRHEARWNTGTLEAGPWIGADDIVHYYAAFAGADCGNYPVGTGSLFSVVTRTGIWPPSGIAELLNMNVATPLDAQEVSVVASSPSR